MTAAAAFKPAAAGSAPPAGIRVVYVQHDNTSNEQDTSVPLEEPVTGNMFAVLYTSGCLDPSTTDCSYPTRVGDGTNNYLQVGSNVVSPASDGGASVGSVWYASGVAPGTYSAVWTMHPRSTGGNGNSYIFYDIAGASNSPLDTGFGGAGNGLASATGDQSTDGGSGNVATLTATPSQANEVIFGTIGAGWNSFTGLANPVGSQFVASNYLTETNSSHCDLNGGWGLYYNGGSTAAETWTWTQDGSNFPGVSDWVALAVAFH